MARPSLAVLKSRKRARDAGLPVEPLEVATTASTALYIDNSKVTKTKPAAINSPIDTAGLFGIYGDLQTLLQEVDEANIKRKAIKTRKVENRLCYENFLPIIQLWLKEKVILDTKVFAYFAYYAIDEDDYPLLIEMADLSIELKVIDFKPYLKRTLQSFIIDEFYTNYHKKYHLLQPDGPRTFKSLRTPYPNWFWTIYQKTVIDKTWWTVSWHEQSWLMGLAVLAHNHAKDYLKAVECYQQLEAIRLDNHSKSGGSGYLQEYEYARAHLQAAS